MGLRAIPCERITLSGFTEVRYDEDLQQVVSTPVELAQEYRVFDYSSPWKTF